MKRFVSLLIAFSLFISPCYATIDFDGADDFVNSGDITTLDGLTTATISMWVLPDTLTDLDEVLTKFNVTGGGFFIGLGNATFGTNNDVLVGVTNEGGDYGYTNVNILAAGTWGHWCLVFNGAGADNASKTKFYFNGVQQTLNFSASAQHTEIPNSAGLFTIGALESASVYTRFWDGQITELRIYNRILTDSEILTLATSRLKMGGVTSGMVMYFPMDGQPAGDSADGDTVRDIVGGQNGTASDGATDGTMTWVSETILNYPLFDGD